MKAGRDELQAPQALRVARSGDERNWPRDGWQQHVRSEKCVSHVFHTVTKNCIFEFDTFSDGLRLPQLKKEDKVLIS